jgi:UDP-3-O-[3-hydroxymyristoyl] glucosamine N-acyltransferase
MEMSARQLAALINGTVIGNAEVLVHSPAPIEQAQIGQFSFLDNPKYEKYAYTTQASILMVSNDFMPTQAIGTTLIRVEHVREALATLLAIIQKEGNTERTISTDARVSQHAQLGENVGVGMFTIVSQGAKVGDNTTLAEQVYVGDHVQIGKECTIYQGVKIHAGTQIGDYCVIKSNAVIGSEGFGFAPLADGTWKKVPQVGIVRIGNHVEIGANTCIDRGALGDTVIHDGCKLDNLIQIGHNVIVGAHTAIAAQVGVAGSAEIGVRCLLGGQAGIAGHIKIADGTKLQAQSGVASTIKEPNQAFFGSPAIAYGDFVRAFLVFKTLPLMEKRLRKVEKEQGNDI